ncbi:hypothetical protein B0H63DRAFT_556992 [Podospora didyma]|uniref:Transmembrane protein n=1 Tax=Podospora didyma TaxID=330526 RepID=A0AAE0NYC2_9PEZI|nr:hypothetical protein B0H63DRAFT_556992 [Podospora didyma]
MDVPSDRPSATSSPYSSAAGDSPQASPNYGDKPALGLSAIGKGLQQNFGNVVKKLAVEGDQPAEAPSPACSQVQLPPASLFAASSNTTNDADNNHGASTIPGGSTQPSTLSMTRGLLSSASGDNMNNLIRRYSQVPVPTEETSPGKRRRVSGAEPSTHRSSMVRDAGHKLDPPNRPFYSPRLSPATATNAPNPCAQEEVASDARPDAAQPATEPSEDEVEVLRARNVNLSLQIRALETQAEMQEMEHQFQMQYWDQHSRNEMLAAEQLAYDKLQAAKKEFEHSRQLVEIKAKGEIKLVDTLDRAISAVKHIAFVIAVCFLAWLVAKYR